LFSEKEGEKTEDGSSYLYRKEEKKKKLNRQNPKLPKNTEGETGNLMAVA